MNCFLTFFFVRYLSGLITIIRVENMSDRERSLCNYVESQNVMIRFLTVSWILLFWSLIVLAVLIKKLQFEFNPQSNINPLNKLELLSGAICTFKQSLVARGCVSIRRINDWRGGVSISFTGMHFWNTWKQVFLIHPLIIKKALENMTAYIHLSFIGNLSFITVNGWHSNAPENCWGVNLNW